MRLNLYTATCSLLAYGITALNIGSLDASLESAASFNGLAQSYADEYDHDLAQTYTDINTDTSRGYSRRSFDRYSDYGGRRSYPSSRDYYSRRAIRGEIEDRIMDRHTDVKRLLSAGFQHGNQNACCG